MLVVSKASLTPEEFRRLESLLAALPGDLRWAKRAGRFVVQLDRVGGSDSGVERLKADPAVEYVLENPSEGEIARIFTRRDLLDLALVSTGVLAAGALLTPLGLFLTAPPGERTRNEERFVGEADRIPVNGSRSVILDGEDHILIRRDESHFHLLSATCTHSNVCVVAWDPKRGELVCPCHAGLFDIYGNVVSGPPPSPLSSRQVVVRDGRLYVRPPKR